MASPAIDIASAPRDRAAINRENAQHSTGPVTDAGRNRVRLNALKHGALSRTVVFPYENQAEFDALGLRLATAYLPVTDEERRVLQDIQATHWRIDRVISLEGNLYAMGIGEEMQPAKNFFPVLDPEGQIGIARARAYSEKARTFEQFHRQEARLRRLLDRQVAAFLDLQSLPTPTGEPAPQAASEPDPQPAPEPELAAAASADGFVSHADSTPAINPPIMPHYIGPLKEFKRKQWLQKHGK